MASSPSKVLALNTFHKIQTFFKTHARDIEREFFFMHFYDTSGLTALSTLEKYQNPDGGFGHGLEPDFHLPLSTPMATSVGLRYLHQIPQDRNPNIIKKKKTMIANALHFLITVFDLERKGWWAVREEVNDFPHAPWWNWNPQTKKTVIDNNWGNPSAEIIAYFVEYRDLIPEIQYQEFIDATLEYSIQQAEKRQEFHSEHEVYCYIHLYRIVDEGKKRRLLKPITQAIDQLLERDTEKWKNYVPKPADFIPDPSLGQFNIPQQLLTQHLDNLVEDLDKNEKISTNWEWGQYPTFWEQAKCYWEGILTLRALKVLENYSRLGFKKEELK